MRRLVSLFPVSLFRVGLYLGIGLLWLGLAVPTVWADAEESFKEGIEAVDLERWREAEGHFRQAVAANGQESDRRIFISGAFSRPYLPHFYLGWALFQQGPDACEAALEAWDVSESQAVVVSFRRLHQDLLKGRTSCRRVLLPKTAAQIGGRLSDLESLMLRLDGSPDALRQRRATEDALATARQRLQASLAAEDLAAVRLAGQVVEEQLKRLEVWLEEAVARASQEQALTSTQAREALAAAERFERQLLGRLADPGLVERRNRLPDPGLAQDLQQRLDGLRRRLGVATEPIQLESLRAEAAAIGAELVALVGRYDQLLAEPVTEIAPAAQEAQVEPPSAGAPPPPASTSPGMGPSVDSLTVSTADAALASLLKSSAELLQWLRDSGLTGRLLQLQSDRLQALSAVAGNGVEAGDEGEALKARLRASHGALQLLAAGQALVQGDALGCLRVLGMGPLEEESWQVQGHLFAAAAHFVLYRRSDGRDAEQWRAATSARDRCLRLRPELVPDRTFFSPAFQAFFLEGAQNR